VLVVLAVAGLFFSITPWGRAGLRSLMLLPGLVAARQLAPIVANGEPIHHVSLTLSSQGGPVYLDVWEPATLPPPPIPGARQGVLIIAGVGDNRTTEQLINLTESLARAGLVAMTMTTPTLIDYVLSRAETDATVQAFKTLLHWPGVGAARVGILGFSAGNAPASLAAADPRIQHQVAFLTFFGGFYNARDLLADIGRRALIVNGQPEAWQPDPLPLSVLANTIAGTLSAQEAEKMRAAFDFHHPTRLASNQVAQLSSPTAAAYHLLAGDQRNQVENNLDALSSQMQQLLQQLSPSSVVGQIRAPVSLLHDRNDAFVPFTESVNFAAELAKLDHSHTLVEFSIFQHTEVSSSLDLRSLLSDGPRLLRALYVSLLPST
jgi:dienelactone hydrolase